MDSTPLFTVPAGTKIDKLENGLWVFKPPNEPAFTLHVDASNWPPKVTKVSELAIGTE